MSKGIWYLVGLVLVAGACSPVLEPTTARIDRGNPAVAQAGQDTSETYGWRGEGPAKRRLF